MGASGSRSASQLDGSSNGGIGGSGGGGRSFSLVSIAPTADLARAVERAAPGSVLHLNAGSYPLRRGLTLRRGVSIEGEGGAEGGTSIELGPGEAIVFDVPPPKGGKNNGGLNGGVTELPTLRNLRIVRRPAGAAGSSGGASSSSPPASIVPARRASKGGVASGDPWRLFTHRPDRGEAPPAVTLVRGSAVLDRVTLTGGGLAVRGGASVALRACEIDVSGGGGAVRGGGQGGAAGASAALRVHPGGSAAASQCRLSGGRCAVVAVELPAPTHRKRPSAAGTGLRRANALTLDGCVLRGGGYGGVLVLRRGEAPRARAGAADAPPAEAEKASLESSGSGSGGGDGVDAGAVTVGGAAAVEGGRGPAGPSPLAGWPPRPLSRLLLGRGGGPRGGDASHAGAIADPSHPRPPSPEGPPPRGPSELWENPQSGPSSSGGRFGMGQGQGEGQGPANASPWDVVIERTVVEECPGPGIAIRGPGASARIAGSMIHQVGDAYTIILTMLRLHIT